MFKTHIGICANCGSWGKEKASPISTVNVSNRKRNHPQHFIPLGNNLFAQTSYVSSSISEVLWEVRVNIWKTDHLQNGLPKSAALLQTPWNSAMSSAKWKISPVSRLGAHCPDHTRVKAVATNLLHHTQLQWGLTPNPILHQGYITGSPLTVKC